MGLRTKLNDMKEIIEKIIEKIPMPNNEFDKDNALEIIVGNTGMGKVVRVNYNKKQIVYINDRTQDYNLNWDNLL